MIVKLVMNSNKALNEAKEKLAEAKLKEEQEKIEAEKFANHSQEDLLKDIRDLLKFQTESAKALKKEKVVDDT